MEKIKIKKGHGISLAIVVSWTLLNQVVGDIFPFSDLPMYAYVPPYGEYYFVTDTAGNVRKERTGGLKKIFTNSLRLQGEFVFEKASADKLMERGLFFLKERFDDAHVKRQEHLAHGLVAPAEKCAATRALHLLKNRDHTPQLHRVLIRIENGKVIRQETLIPTGGCKV